MNKTIQNLEAALAKAREQEAKQNAGKRFICACGKLHAIKDCTVIQTHWYTPPRGCCEGDYWNTGELRVVCPTTQIRNRVLFETRSEVPWEKRQDYAFSPEMQFSRQYRCLFKSVIEDHDQDRGPTFNNYYFDKNHKKFGIQIADVTS